MALFTIFGATGYIGSHVCEMLVRENHEVARPERGEIPKGDLGHVIYCIGLTADYSARPFDTVAAHASYFSELLRRSSFTSCLYLSSTRLYDSLERNNASEDSTLHLNPKNPRHLFDISKALGESIALNCHRDNVRIARLSCVYGGDLSTPGFIHDLIKRVNKGQYEIDSFSNLYRDYVHIDDVCKGLIDISMAGQSDIYNLASGINTSNAEIFKKIEELTSHPIIHNGETDWGMNNLPINIGRIRREFAFQPKLLINELRRMIKTSKWN